MRRMTWTCLAALLGAGFATTASASGLVGLDVMTATVMQEKQSSFSGIALRMRIVSPRLMNGIEIMPVVEYWRNSNTVDPFGIHTTRKDATVGGDVRYSFRTTGTRPYLGAGFGLHFLSSSVDAPSLGINNESHSLVRGGLSALGGVSFPLTARFDNFVELKYHHVPNYRQLKFNWGLGIGF
jgi:hypothetical protein